MKKVNEVMTRDVQIVPSSCSVQEAGQLMKDFDVGILPVCDGERLLGAITDRDIVLRVVAQGYDPQTATVTDAVSFPPIYCFEDQEVADVVRIMEDQQIRRLLVLDTDKKLVGIVSLGDIAVKGGNEELSGEVLEQISKPAHKKSAA